MFDRITGAEPFRFFVFVESGILVFPVCMGLFGGWGPLGWRRGMVVRFLSIAKFVEEFVEEAIHGWCSSGVDEAVPNRSSFRA